PNPALTLLSTPLPYSTLFRSAGLHDGALVCADDVVVTNFALMGEEALPRGQGDAEVSPLRVGQLDAVSGGKRSGICHRKTLTYRSEEHTSELQSRFELVCRLL